MSSYKSAVTAADFHSETRAFFRGRQVAVLGGSGFIGSHVVEQLLALGATPVVLTRSTEPPFLFHLPHVKRVRGDLRDSAVVAQAIKGTSVVLLLAAKVAGIEYNAKHPATIFMDNMEIFFNALRSIAAAKVERLLITSSACVYPRHCSIPTPESEGFLNSPEPTNRGYGWAKRMEEMLGETAAQEFGLSVSIGRPYNAYGPRDNFDPATSHVLPALIRKAAAARDGIFDVWGDGSHSRSFVYVDDVARGLLEIAARYPQADPLNVGTPEEVTIRAAAELIAFEVSKLTGRSVHPRFDPAALTGQPRRCCDISKAQRLLDYTARVPFREGLQVTVEWYMRSNDASRKAQPEHFP